LLRLQCLRLFGLSLTFRFVFTKTQSGALFLVLFALTSSPFFSCSLFLAIALFYRSLPYKYPMPDLKCPRCGRLSKGVCGDCYLRDHPVSVKPESFRECGCGLVLFKGRWSGAVEAMYRELAVKSIKPPSGVDLKVLGVNVERDRGRAVWDVDVLLSCGGSELKQKLTWSVKPESTMCEMCRKLGSGYFEAVLQVRGEAAPLDLDKRQVAKVERVRGGSDYYMLSAEYTRIKASELINRGYLVKDSSKLYGMKKGKQIYRYYFSVRKPPFDVGYFIEHKGRVMRITGVGRAVKLADLSTGKVTSTPLSQIEESRVLAKPADVREALITEVRPDGMQIMDKGGYETFHVPVKAGARQGQDVGYVKVKGRIYVL